MIARRLPMLAVASAGVITLAVATRDTPGLTEPVFSRIAAPWMPAAPAPGGLTSTWYCPGVPAAPDVTPATEGPEDTEQGEEGEQGEDGAAASDDRTAGRVVVVNPDADAMRGTLTVLTEDEGEPVIEPFTIDPFATHEVDLDELVESAYAAAVVEIEGGGGLVEQVATWPIGTNSVADSVSPCANSPSDTWYFATGDTSAGSRDLLVLSNPHDHSAVVDVELSTSRGPRSISSFTVPAKAVRWIDLREHTVNDEVNVGVSIVASRGSLIAARAQTYDTPSRDGYSMVLGAPALREQWWFAAGVNADDVTVEFAIYNPGDSDVTVNPVLLGFDEGPDYQLPDPIEVPDGEVATFSIDDVEGLPDGPVSAVFGTDGAPIVVERTLTRVINGIRTTSVSPGGPTRTDGYVANTWYLGVGPGADQPTEQALQILNVDGADAVVTVQAITPSGIVTVPSLESVPLGGYATITVDLTDPAALGRALIVRSTSRVFVERVLPREAGAVGRVASWLLPAN